MPLGFTIYPLVLNIVSSYIVFDFRRLAVLRHPSGGSRLLIIWSWRLRRLVLSWRWRPFLATPRPLLIFSPYYEKLSGASLSLLNSQRGQLIMWLAPLHSLVDYLLVLHLHMLRTWLSCLQLHENLHTVGRLPFLGGLGSWLSVVDTLSLYSFESWGMYPTDVFLPHIYAGSSRWDWFSGYDI